MSAAAPTAAGLGGDVISDEDRQRIKGLANAGLRDRKELEPLWEECLAFAQGHHWITFGHKANRTLITIPAKRGEERVENDELTQFRLTLLGELELDDDRPQALFRQNEAPSEDYAEEANDALAYGWDEEWHAQRALTDARRTVIDVGTAPIRCRWEPDYGPYLDRELPMLDGRPVSPGDALSAYEKGQRFDLKRLRQGRIVWEAGTPFNVIVPPRTHRERLFPWEFWVSVHMLDELKAQYPHAATELVADPIRSVAKVTGGDAGSRQGDDPEAVGNADRQCFLYTFYERPCRKHPDGRVVLLGSTAMVPLEARPQLGYKGPDGQYRSGVHYLHGIRLTDRFWSRGFMELGLSPQRTINRRLTQINKTIDRGQAKVYLEKGALDRMPDGIPAEVVWMKPGKPKPVIDQGIPPGPWLQANIDANRQNLERAVLPSVSLGENPPGVITYAQLATLKEQASRRLEPILADHREVIVGLCEDSACDIKRYWGREKLVAIGGDESHLRSFRFDATQWPDYTKFSFAKGAALPRSQGAQLQLIQDLWNGALQSGAVAQNPPAWLEWYQGSLQAGKPLDMPLPPADIQRDKAQYENDMLAHGTPPVVDYFDDHEKHIAEHRIMQIQARLDDEQQMYMLAEQHIQQHLAAATQNAQLAPQPQQPQLPPGAAGPDQGAPAQPQQDPLAAAQQAQQIQQAQQQAAQQAELHQHAVRQASAQATLAERQAVETQINPQPPGS